MLRGIRVSIRWAAGVVSTDCDQSLAKIIDLFLFGCQQVFLIDRFSAMLILRQDQNTDHHPTSDEPRMSWQLP